MYVKKNTRVTFRSNRRQGHKRNNIYSNGKGRNKGNITQLHQKYLKLAKEASSSGDRIQSEYYYQFADHYSRLMIELGINIEDNLDKQTSIETRSIDQKSENDNNFAEQIEINKDKDIVEVENDDNHGSIESVPFISEPIKKKSVKTKKNST